MGISREDKRSIGRLRPKSDLKHCNVTTQVTPWLKGKIEDRVAFLDKSKSAYIRDLILEDMDDCGLIINSNIDQEYWQ